MGTERKARGPRTGPLAKCWVVELRSVLNRMAQIVLSVRKRHLKIHAGGSVLPINLVTNRSLADSHFHYEEDKS